jgi:hypothetical protein
MKNRESGRERERERERERGRESVLQKKIGSRCMRPTELLRDKKV